MKNLTPPHLTSEHGTWIHLQPWGVMLAIKLLVSSDQYQVSVTTMTSDLLLFMNSAKDHAVFTGKRAFTGRKH